MQITRIDDIHQFDKLKTAWDTVYSADPHAHIFASWAWLRSFFEVTPYHWSVLALRPNNVSLCVAFFPFAIQEHKSIIARVLHVGGSPVADHTGFVFLPEYREYEEQAVFTFADKEGAVFWQMSTFMKRGHKEEASPLPVFSKTVSQKN